MGDPPLPELSLCATIGVLSAERSLEPDKEVYVIHSI
jgi:hypothetical protein